MLSQPVYEGKVRICHMRVPMRDGVEMGVKVTRPDTHGQFPAVMEYNPYRRIHRALPDYRDEYPPVVPFLAERGYVTVQYDVRGTGNSGGSSQDVYSEDERKDSLDMIEWIAEQPWFGGSIGMVGKSYSACVQWQVAVQTPAHLKAIIVRSGNDNVYTDWVYPGGQLNPYMFNTYSPIMTAMNFAPPDPDVVGDIWSALWQERLNDSRPWGVGYITHPLDGPYWEARSLAGNYDRVRCAVYVIGGWADWYATELLRAFARLKCPKKALVGPWGHWYAEEGVAVPGPRIDSRVEYLRWFDYWLKGMDTGVMDEPPVTLFVQGYHAPAARMCIEQPGYWRVEQNWPVTGGKDTSLYFHPGGQLKQEPFTGGETCDRNDYDPRVGVASGMIGGGGLLPWGMPLDQRADSALSIGYATEPLENDLEVIGTATVALHISSTAAVAYFNVKLIDVAPDGLESLVCSGGLNATHRDSHRKPEPLRPGDVYELRIPLNAVAYVFEAGHRIRVTVTNADLHNAWPTPYAAENRVHLGERYPSRIVIPVAVKRGSEQPEPHFRPLSPADPNVLEKPTAHSVVRDHVNGTATVLLATEKSFDVQSKYTVSSVNPAETVLEARHRYVAPQKGADIVVEANEVTTSDVAAFHHVSMVHITVQGKPFFEKSWAVSVPRELA